MVEVLATWIAGLLIASLSIQSPVKIDVKTPAGEKDKLKVVKAGLNAFLKQSDWAKVVNLSEDYSIILCNYKRKLKGNIVRFELDLELRTGSVLGSGKLISSKHLADSIDLAEAAKLHTVEEREMHHFVLEQLTKNQKYKSALDAVGSLTGVPVASALVEKGLSLFGVELEGNYRTDQAVEGMVMGALLMVELQPMIESLNK